LIEAHSLEECSMRLFEFELTWAKVAFDALFPEGSALPHGIARMAPERRLHHLLLTCPWEQAMALRLSIWLLALAPLLLLRRAVTLSGASPTEREHVLARLYASSIYVVRQLAVAFKATAALFYAQSPEVRAAMLAVSPMTEAATEAAPAPVPDESGVVLRVRRSKKGEAVHAA
jgi:hypothetical protein